jgi:thioredoxin-related protein
MPANSQNRLKNSLLPLPTDLQAAARAAEREGQPLVLMVSLPGCPWCELLRRNYLAPMRAEGLPAFEFMIHDRSSAMRDFQGKSTTPEQLARQWKVTNTPTLLFLGRSGEEIAERIEGVASADFIGAVIDERLATARARIKTAR